MIKVGQVYRQCDGRRIAVTTVYSDHIDDVIFDIVDNMGEVTAGFIPMNLLGDKLIAEYPTWQEAVNSKEFME